MLWSWRKKLRNIGKTYSWFVYSGTIMIMVILCQLLTQMTSLSIFLTSILQHFIIANKFIISFLFSKLTYCWFYLLLVSPFMFRLVFMYDLSRIYQVTCEILIRLFFLFFHVILTNLAYYSLSKSLFVVFSCELYFVNYSGRS